MAHKQQQEFFEGLAIRFSDCLSKASKVLEVGSQNINGSVRQYFPNATEYLGIDIGLAADVDWVIPGELIELPNGWAEVTISTECFEHCEAWRMVFVNMIRIASPGSLVIITCASHGRPTHGTLDSEEYSSPFTTSYYKNLGIDELSEKVRMGAYFDRHAFEVNSSSHDLYFWGIRSNEDIQSADEYWDDPTSRLARAQGQLAQAAARHSACQAELDRVKNEAEQARAEAEQAKTEAEQARAESEQARAEAEQARAEAEQASTALRSIQDSDTWKALKQIRITVTAVKKLFPY